MRRAIRIFVPILLLIAGVGGAQEPPWILLERGKTAFENRNLTSALDFILEAVESTEDFPEGEYWLGRVYAAQGQSVLAEEQYRRAVRMALYLRVPDDRFSILYSLADLLLQMESDRWSEAEIVLSEISDSEGATTPQTIELEHRYVDTLINDGLDELVFLYRDELRQSLRARRMLGELAWAEGRYRTALLHSSRSVFSMLSTLSDEYRNYDPNWRFDIDPIRDQENPDRDVRFPESTDGVQDLMRLISLDRPELLNWLDDVGFWPQLYLLSMSLYANGYERRAEALWDFLAPADSLTGEPTPSEKSGRWGILAARQLDEPFIPVGSLGP